MRTLKMASDANVPVVVEMAAENITFNQEALANWIELCNEVRRLRRAGASEDELAIMSVRIIVQMATLLPISNEEAANLALALLRNNNTASAAEEAIAVDPIPVDPIPATQETGDEPVDSEN
jgi:hypothetical protein